MENEYIKRYVDKMEELFTEYKKEPSDKVAMDMHYVIHSFLNVGYRLPLKQNYFPLTRDETYRLFTPQEVLGKDGSK